MSGFKLNIEKANILLNLHLHKEGLPDAVDAEVRVSIMDNSIMIDYKKNIFDLILEAECDISPDIESLDKFFFSLENLDHAKTKSELSNKIYLSLFDGENTSEEDILSFHKMLSLEPLDHFEVLNFLKVSKMHLSKYIPIFGSLISLSEKNLSNDSIKRELSRIPVISVKKTKRKGKIYFKRTFSQTEYEKSMKFAYPFYVFSKEA